MTLPLEVFELFVETKDELDAWKKVLDDRKELRMLFRSEGSEEQVRWFFCFYEKYKHRHIRQGRTDYMDPIEWIKDYKQQVKDIYNE